MKFYSLKEKCVKNKENKKKLQRNVFVKLIACSATVKLN